MWRLPSPVLGAESIIEDFATVNNGMGGVISATGPWWPGNVLIGRCASATT
jgi:hypothetical protein